jgi:hypothetical protein
VEHDRKWGRPLVVGVPTPIRFARTNQFEYEGLTGTLLDLWVDDLHGTQHVFGLWQADQLTGRRQVDRCILSLGPGFNLERIKAEVGPLPARNWLYREPDGTV